MTSQQIKSYVSLRQFDQITRFESVSDEQTVKSYLFTEELQSTSARLLAEMAGARGAWAIVGERGVGKSHLLALLRGLANDPLLLRALEDSEAIASFERLAIGKLPSDGLPTISINFDPDKGLNYIKAYPRIPELDGEIPPAQLGPQLDDLLEQRISQSKHFALLIDGISQHLKHPKQGPILLEWLKELAAESKERFCLVVVLDQDLIGGNKEIAPQLREIFQIEQLRIENLAVLMDQRIFRKSPQQRKLIEALYPEMRARMPHFTGSQHKFSQLYPLHPAILEVAPAMRRYARSFSLFGFITAVASRTLLRRALNLISLDDLFESFEFDLRKQTQLVDIFASYDYLFTQIISKMGQPHSLYAKMLLKGLLLFSLAGRRVNVLELADGVMLYDDRDSETFHQLLNSIMAKLAEATPTITVSEMQDQRCYQFQLPGSKKPAEGSVATGNLAARPQDPLSEILPQGNERLRVNALAIPDDELQLDQLLIAAGKKHFKDWPFTFEAQGSFRDRTELNLKWRGSLRKGIFKFGGTTEIYTNEANGSEETSRTGEARPFCEHDWQITVMRAYSPHLLPPPPDAPATLLFWPPNPLVEADRLLLKYLLAAQRDSERLFSSKEEAQQVITALENRVAELFQRVYLKEGHLLTPQEKELSLSQASSFINTTLTRLLDNPLNLRYPAHPKFEELLVPEYVDEMISWLFATDQKPTPDQLTYLEQFARPLQLITSSGEKYQLNSKDFSADSAIAVLLAAIDQAGQSLSKQQAYQLLRREPYGLQRPALMLMLAALAAGRRIILADETGQAIHDEQGLSPDADLADFTTIYSQRHKPQQVSWQSIAKQERPARETDFQDYTIMVVDDDPTIHMVLEMAAATLKCRVEKALDGAEALEKLQHVPIDLVISDLRMPNMSGVELFRKMQANPFLRDIPFVVLSSIETDAEVAAALDSGVEDYWIKPFRMQEIQARIKRVLRRSMTNTSSYALAAWPEPAAASTPATPVAADKSDKSDKSDKADKTDKAATGSVAAGAADSKPAGAPTMNLSSIKIDAAPVSQTMPLNPAMLVNQRQSPADRVPQANDNKVSQMSTSDDAGQAFDDDDAVLSTTERPPATSYRETRPLTSLPNQLTGEAGNENPVAATKILPAPAVSRLRTDKNTGSLTNETVSNNQLTTPTTGEMASVNSGNLSQPPISHPPIPHPPIPHPPIPHPPVPGESLRTREFASPPVPTPIPPIVPPPVTRNDEDRLAIRSVTSEYPIISGPLPEFQVEVDDVAPTAKSSEESDQPPATIFCIKLSQPESMPIDIMQLYNQFWDTCRRVGQPTSIPEYEEFKEIVISRAKKLKKQFHCDELLFTVEVEAETAHVDCQVKPTSDFLKTPPKLRLF